MWFWIRNIILLLILGSVGYVLLARPDILVLSNRTNKAAEGLSNFYSSIRSSISDSAGKISDFRLVLPDTSEDLTDKLQQRTAIVTPLEVIWRGQVSDRRFREGETLKNRLTDYAQQQGIQLYWTLPRDYIVKHYFQTDTSLIGTVYEISQAIAPDFASPVLAYFCPQQRAAIITDKANSYIQQHCIPAQRDPVTL
ncbi:Toxin co-regulated pilus biosynthesis protein Q C-terminal domain-containing protein [Rheinheimera salexigens]|uniref:TcpQ domain-containing protein n=1 Tax=Rheinheimera salexigens TaxID=1628148 RepID=UPI0039F0D1C9